MENNNNNQQNNSSSASRNTSATGTSNNPQGSIGSAGSEGTQAYNNGNEGRTGNDRGMTESGAFDEENKDNYEGGSLGTAGSGGMEIPSAKTGAENAGTALQGSSIGIDSDQPKVPIPVVKDNYEGGSMGTAGSGGMEMHGSESSLSTDTLSNNNTGDKSNEINPSRNPHGLGSPPAPAIADGGDGGAKQPKEHTGKDTEMGGATGGTEGMGNGNSNTGIEGEGVGNKDGSASGSGGGGSSAGSSS